MRTGAVSLRRILRALGLLSIAVGLCVIDALYIEPNFPRVVRRDVCVRDLPPSLSGIKILHLSDLHIVTFGKREERALRIIHRIKPDVICLTGDYIGDDGITPGEHTDQYCIEQAARFIARLRAPYGIYAVRGNWDPISDIPQFDRAGVHWLDGTSVVSRVRDSSLRLASCAGIAARSSRSPRERVVTVVLEHYPYDIEFLATVNPPVDLILAGHWHGGQVGWPLRMTEAKYLAGLYTIGETQLYVSRGLGMHTRAVRFNCPSEITVLTLKRG